MLAGTRTISIMTKQAGTGLAAGYRPTMVVKANPAGGIPVDVTGTAPNGAGWVMIGPLTVSPTSDCSVWVELHNNFTDSYQTAFFDDLKAT